MSQFIEQARDIILNCVRHPSCGDMKVTIHYDNPLNCHVYLGLDTIERIYGLNVRYEEGTLTLSFYNWYQLDIVRKYVPGYQSQPFGSATCHVNTENLAETIEEEVMMLLFNHLTTDVNGNDDDSCDIFIEYTSLNNDSVKYRKIEKIMNNTKKKLPDTLIKDDIIEQIEVLISEVLNK
ncbi:Hypothetical protein ORPV_944 [Orpheovirus IHUMI-LCC2]|uniref:Uncharacterized protein n=1 Tax=Orpheovirus IHUMI-LCC2 TaxID=2023057 RepID=A0A2I2L5M2_9VIRU|nr:Hypothetical protein ORPV_944 [Orpheovirus IHUMI-LCC2]SNW62848.1 Hypothetical protein ORPV_944 [Orpheovirus IHUMI-LCC2]